MALTRLVIDGYGQVEINNCAFRRDGRIEAQCAPDTTNFATAKVENGMLLAVNAGAHKVAFATDTAFPIALVYSAEHCYEDGKTGLKDFALNGKNDFLPRLGYPAVGDKYTTNCISYDSAVDTGWTSQSAVISALKAFGTTPVYAGVCSNGSHLISATAPTQGPVMRVIDATTMPDGSFGVKFQVMSC